MPGIPPPPPAMKTIHKRQLEQSGSDWSVHMQRALELARNVITAKPNPRVGCVITVDNTVVAEGWHPARGQPHAEVMALANARADTRGGTAFVSLEPCNHHGNTGPCSDALINAGIGTVVLAMIDPNPRVCGQGVRRLEQAGIKVFQLQDLEQAAAALNRGYVKRHRSGRPYLTMKLASSMDGRTALANGRSQWITGTAARSDVQRLRAASGAIVTGIGTVLADDPRLDVRVEEMGLGDTEAGNNRECLQSQPLRIVIDSSVRTPATARVLRGAGKAIIYTSEDTNPDRANPFRQVGGVEIRRLGNRGERTRSGVPLRSVLESLAADFQCNDVLLEAGPTLCGAFLAANLVDELVLYLAPKLLGSDGKPLMNLTDIQCMADAPRFAVVEHGRLGDDIKLVLRPRQD